MAKIRNKGGEIRRFIVSQVQDHPNDIAGLSAGHFGISRQAVHKHLQRLIEDKVLVAKGATRNKQYELRTLREWRQVYALNAALEEGVVWHRDIRPLLERLPDNALDIWQYGFTEMFNNVIDHSEGGLVIVGFEENAAVVEIAVTDDGVGIFKKIQAEAGLPDERHATLELAKGKFTTDPNNHTGEGIFFTSRMFDGFAILSGEVCFALVPGQEERIGKREGPGFGTTVYMRLNNHVSRTALEVFNRFSSGDEFGFTRTIVPVRLAQYGDDKLVSRSQARRVLARIDRFHTVSLDFSGVESIGQAFADEIFRVFARRHPEIALDETGANSDVKRMIRRARSVG